MKTYEIIDRFPGPLSFAEWEKKFPEEAKKLIAEIGEDAAEKLRRMKPPEGLEGEKSVENLSPRVRKLLEGAGIETLAQLKETDAETLLAIKGFGEAALAEVRNKLKEAS